ncbi:MAG: type II toxin-antitoxin system RelE/ParE family toxin [Verrucomicrobia bacterium]|nr:type II toxin-antitoxin system RelE/ParE family toxin [Cytophagales bacterium]
MEIIWSPRAESEFIKDIDYLGENYGRKTATRYMEQLTDAIEKISKIDMIAYQLVDAEKDIRKYKVNANKNLYYRLTENKLEIIAFYSDKQNPDTLTF